MKWILNLSSSYNYYIYGHVAIHWYIEHVNIMLTYVHVHVWTKLHAYFTLVMVLAAITKLPLIHSLSGPNWSSEEAIHFT